MNLNAGSVEAWMAFFLIQAVPTGAALVRLFLIPPQSPFPREGKILAFDSFVFIFLCLLLLLDLCVYRFPLRAEWILLAASVAAVYALILSAEFSSHAAVSSYAARILYPAPNLKWLVVSLSAFPVLFAIGSWLNSLIPVFAKATQFLYAFPGGRTLEHVPLIFITNAVFAGGIGGEPFWRGVLYPRLRKRRPFLRAAFLTGIAQAIWFIPCELLVGRGFRGILLLSALFLSASPVFAWVYERSRRSLLAAVIMFGSMTTALHFIPLSFSTVGTVILLFPTVLLAEKRIRRKR